MKTENEKLVLKRESQRMYLKTSKGKITHKKAVKNYHKNNPWARTMANVASRCSPSGKYYKKGIRNFLTPQKLKELWFRDKAWKLEKPSIDRINAKGNYTFENCRYIEWSKNSDEGRDSRWAETRKQKTENNIVVPEPQEVDL